MKIEDIFELVFIMTVVDFAAASANIWIKKTYRLVLVSQFRLVLFE
jgi:hypothetical protein